MEYMISTPCNRKYYFISGLPRSGSTLTSAILRQNPRFHAGISSPVASLFEGILGQISASTELSTTVTEIQRENLLRGIVDSYYAQHKEPVIFDTNRAWSAKLPILMRLFPDAKVVCLVRDVSWIMDSIERQFRENTFDHTRLFNSPAERSTVYTRLEALAGANRLVGYAWHALREACYSEFADRIVLVEYDLLTNRPEEVFQLLYNFLDEDPFVHDFGAVDYDAPAFDAQLGLRGLHRVHRQVKPRPRETILPPDLFQRYSNLAYWRDLSGSRAFKIVVKQTSTEDQKSMPGETSPIGSVSH